MGETVLSIRGLSVALPAEADRRFAVEDVSLDLRKGEILCVVGESGSGKSVLANAVMGLLPPRTLRIAGGSIAFHGTDLLTLPESRRRGLRGRSISMIFQEPMTALNPIMRVEEQIDEVLRAHGVTDPMQRADRVLELLRATSLPDPERLRHSYPFQLSGGQRQRVMIAMALTLEPEILIADEPTTALDVTTQAQVLRLIGDLQRRLGIAVLFITHDFGVVADIADRVAVMQHGRVVESGRVSDILNRPAHPYTQRLIAAVPRLKARAAPAEPAAEPLLAIEGLTKTYRGRPALIGRPRREVAALKQVSLELRRGETLGIVGESGSGKSTLGACVVRLLDWNGGTIRFEGADVGRLRGAALRRFRAQVQMVFQDPFASLNPRHRVRRIVTEPAIVNGVPRAEAEARMARLMALVGLDAAAADRYPHEFSGGQRQRIGIARALVLEPRLIVADEPVSALDVSVQEQVLALLADIRQRLGLSMLFITHDLRVAAAICDRIAVMHQGEVVECDAAARVFARPRHAYTRALLDAIPGRDWEAVRA